MILSNFKIAIIITAGLAIIAFSLIYAIMVYG